MGVGLVVSLLLLFFIDWLDWIRRVEAELRVGIFAIARTHTHTHTHTRTYSNNIHTKKIKQKTRKKCIL